MRRGLCVALLGLPALFWSAPEAAAQTATCIMFDATSYSTVEGSDARLKVSMNGILSQAITVTLRGTDGTATSGDYTGGDYTAMIPAGYRSATFDVPTTRDTDPTEGDETFLVSIRSSSVPTMPICTPNQATVTIRDVPEVQMFQSAASVNENEREGAAVVRVVKRGNGPAAVRYFTQDIRAKAGEDYAHVEGILTWRAGSTRDGLIVIPLINDREGEGSEAFNVQLEPAPGRHPPTIIGTRESRTVTILDDDPRTGVLTVEGFGGRTEAFEGERLSFAMSLSSSVGHVRTNIRLCVASGSTAGSGDVHGLPTFSFAFRTDRVSQNITFRADLQRENSERLILEVCNLPDGIRLADGEDGRVEILIRDRQVAELTGQGSGTMREGESRTLRVALSHPAPPGGVTVPIVKSSGSASNTDYIVEDVFIREGRSWGETVLHALSDGTTENRDTLYFRAGDVGDYIGSSQTRGFPIVDSTSSIGMTISAPVGGFTLFEGRGAESTASWTVVLDNDPGVRTTVEVRANNDSVEVVGGRTTTFGPAATLVFMPGDDGDWDVPQSVQARAVSNDGNDRDDRTRVSHRASGEGIGVFYGQDVQVTAVDAANTATVRFKSSAWTVDEGAGNATLTVTKSGNAAAEVDYTTEDIGGAQSALDYGTISGTLRWDAGETGDKTISVGIADDTDAEGPESFRVRLTAVVDALHKTVLGKPDTAVVTIADNDFTVSFERGTATVDEGAGTVRLPLVLSHPRGEATAVTVSFADGTADTADYVSTSYTATFAPGETRAEVSIGITDDNVLESDENFSASIVSGTLPAGVTAGNTPQVQVTIEDNEYTASFDQFTWIIDEGARVAVLTGTLSRALKRDVELGFEYPPFYSQATLGEDYRRGPATMIVRAGRTTFVHRTPFIDNSIPEDNESFRVEVSPDALPDGATAGVVDVIIRDDDHPVFSDNLSAVAGEPVRVTVRFEPSQPILGPLVVDVATETGSVAGNATEGTDYTGGPYRLSIPPSGGHGWQVEIPTAADADTAAETFTVRVQVVSYNGVSLSIGNSGTATATIHPTGTPVPLVTVAAGQTEVTEGDPVSFTLTADPRPSQDLTVALRVFAQGAHVLSDDDDGADHAVTVAAATGTGTLTLTTVADPSNENGEVVAILLDPALIPESDAGAYPYAVPQGSSEPLPRVRVRDHPDRQRASLPVPPTFTIAADAAQVTEGGAVSFTITADPAPQQDIEIRVSADERMGEGEDQIGVGRSETVLFKAGETSTTWTFTTHSDDDARADGTIEAHIDPDWQNLYEIGDPSTATMALIDDDGTPPPANAPVTVSLAAERTSIAEANGETKWTVGLSRALAAGETVTVPYAVSGGEPGAHWSVEFRSSDNGAGVTRHGHGKNGSELRFAAGGRVATLVLIGRPTTDTLERTIRVAFGTGTGTRAPSSTGIALGASSFEVVIIDDDGPSNLGGTVSSVDPALVAKVRAYAAETHYGSAHVNRWKRVLVAFGVETYPGVTAMTVAEAQARADQGLARWVPVAAALQALADAEGTQTPPPPPEPTITVAAGTSPVTEGTDAVFTLTANPTPQAPLAVTVAVAASGDYGIAAGERTVTIPNGGSLTLTLPTTDDGTDEPDGSATVTVKAGSGYTVGSPASGNVAIRDDDLPPPAISIAAKTASVTEGGNAVFTVTADRAPDADLPVGIAVAESGGGDHVAAQHEGARTATILKGQTTAEVAVPTVNDTADEPDGTVTAMLKDGAGYTLGGASSAQVKVADNDATTGPALSIEDATGREGDLMMFTIRLSAPSDRPVRVYAGARESSPVSARANVDFPTSRYWVEFRPGETVKERGVFILDDSHDDGGETFEVYLYDAIGAPIADGVAVGTIENDDPLPAAWLKRFGRTVAEQALDGIAGRMAAPRTTGMQGTLAGQALGFGPGGDAAGPVDAALAMADITRGFDRSADGSGGTESFGSASPSGFGAPQGQSLAMQSRTMTARDALLGSSFSLTGQKDGAGGSLAFWGRASQGSFDGKERGDGTDISLDGTVTTGLLGVDYARGRWLLGLALTQSSAEGDYAALGAAGCPPGTDGQVPALCDDAVRAGDGKIEASLTAAIPYAALQASERLRLWGAAGHGTGDVTVKTALGARYKTDTSWSMAAAGTRSDLLDTPNAGDGGPALALISDVLWTRTTSEKTRDLAASDSDTTRLRLGLEGSWRVALEGGGSLVPKLEIGARHDGGDAESGFGVELGGGIAWSDPALGLSLDVSGRTLLAHEDSDFEDRGYAASLAFDPAPATQRGPSLSLRQDWGGQATGGLDALFARDPLAERTESGATAPTSRWSMEAAYGFPAFGGRFTGSPHVGLGLASHARDYRIGWRLTSAVLGEPGFEVNLDATRRERANGNEAEHILMLGGALTW